MPLSQFRTVDRGRRFAENPEGNPLRRDLRKPLHSAPVWIMVTGPPQPGHGAVWRAPAVFMTLDRAVTEWYVPRESSGAGSSNDATIHDRILRMADG